MTTSDSRMDTSEVNTMAKKRLIWCECLADLCDGGMWVDSYADMWVDEHGELYISFGGGWCFYDDMEGLPEDYFLVTGNISNLVRHWNDGTKHGCDHIPPFDAFTVDFVPASQFDMVTDYSMFDAKFTKEGNHVDS